MKVLLGAYACEPNKGSEPAVGWNWAVEIARLGHQVHVLTRANNRPAIEAALASGDWPEDLHFHYYDLKPWQRFWKRGRRGMYLYYILWQLGAGRRAAELHRKERFDLVHHLTFVSIKLPTFMGRLGIPFILGPLGGGESAPALLRRGYSLRGKASDLARDASLHFFMANPAIRRSHREASRIFVTSKENISLVDSRQRHKVEVAPAVGAPMATVAQPAEPVGPLKLLYVGRFLHWKGIHLALAALAEAKRQGLHATLTLVGAGPEKSHLVRLAVRLGIEDDLIWTPWVDHDRIGDVYAAHHLFLFPSLHDSGGAVLLEAASFGVPAVCLDLGGPGVLVSDSAGLKIDVTGATEQRVAALLAGALLELDRDRERLASLSRAAILSARRQNWAAVVQRVYESVSPLNESPETGAPTDRSPMRRDEKAGPFPQSAPEVPPAQSRDESRGSASASGV